MIRALNSHCFLISRTSLNSALNGILQRGSLRWQEAICSDQLDIALYLIPLPSSPSPLISLSSPCLQGARAHALHPGLLVLQLQKLHLTRKDAPKLVMLLCLRPYLSVWGLFFSLSSQLSTDKVTPRDSLSECLAANPPYSQKTSSNREKLDGALTDISNHSFNPIIILSNKAGHLLFYISCLFAI